MVLTSQPTENSYVIDLKASEFDAQNEVYARSLRHGLTPDEAAALVARMVDESRRLVPIPPKRPTKTRWPQLKQHAMDFGKSFELGVRQFFKSEDWLINGGKEAAWDSWASCGETENFASLVREAQAGIARLAAQEKCEREERQKADAEAKVWRQERLMADYLLALTTPDWQGMPDADREFKESAAIVDEELGEQSLGVWRRAKHHETDELINEKGKLRDLLTECAGWAKRGDAEAQEEHAKQIKGLLEWIDSASIEAIRKYSWRVTDLHTSLNPDTPRVTQEMIDRGEF